MSQFDADMLPRPLIQIAVSAIAVASFARCGVASEQFVTFAGVDRTQYMKAFKSALIKRLAGGGTVCYRRAT